MFLRTSLHELRLTLRHVGRAKAFYASAVLTLALGIAGATVMFTLVRGILLRPLPVPNEDRLVVSWRVPRSGLATHVPYRSADVEEIRRVSRSFEKITGVGYHGAFEQDWRFGDVWITAKPEVSRGWRHRWFGAGIRRYSRAARAAVRNGAARSREPRHGCARAGWYSRCGHMVASETSHARGSNRGAARAIAWVNQLHVVRGWREFIW